MLKNCQWQVVLWFWLQNQMWNDCLKKKNKEKRRKVNSMLQFEADVVAVHWDFFGRTNQVEYKRKLITDVTKKKKPRKMSSNLISRRNTSQSSINNLESWFKQNRTSLCLTPAWVMDAAGNLYLCYIKLSEVWTFDCFNYVNIDF